MIQLGWRDRLPSSGHDERSFSHPAGRVGDTVRQGRRGREFSGRLAPAAGGVAAARQGILCFRPRCRRYRRQSGARRRRQDRAPGALRRSADRSGGARGGAAQGASVAREPQGDRRQPAARARPAGRLHPGRDQAALSRLAGSAGLLRALGATGRPLSARPARRAEGALRALRPLVRCPAGAQSPAGLPGRLPRARSGLSAARPFRGGRDRGRGARSAGASPALRRVLDDTLAGIDRLLGAAGDLPRALESRRLAAEFGDHSGHRPPPRGRAAPPRSFGRARRARPTAFAGCALRGLARTVWPARRQPTGQPTVGLPR